MHKIVIASSGLQSLMLNGLKPLTNLYIEYHLLALSGKLYIFFWTQCFIYFRFIVRLNLWILTTYFEDFLNQILNICHVWVGEGAFSKVYLAESIQDKGGLAAVKVIDLDFWLTVELIMFDFSCTLYPSLILCIVQSELLTPRDISESLCSIGNPEGDFFFINGF